MSHKKKLNPKFCLLFQIGAPLKTCPNRPTLWRKSPSDKKEIPKKGPRARGPKTLLCNCLTHFPGDPRRNISIIFCQTTNLLLQIWRQISNKKYSDKRTRLITTKSKDVKNNQAKEQCKDIPRTHNSIVPNMNSSSTIIDWRTLIRLTKDWHLNGPWFNRNARH